MLIRRTLSADPRTGTVLFQDAPLENIEEGTRALRNRILVGLTTSNMERRKQRRTELEAEIQWILGRDHKARRKERKQRRRAMNSSYRDDGQAVNQHLADAELLKRLPEKGLSDAAVKDQLYERAYPGGRRPVEYNLDNDNAFRAKVSGHLLDFGSILKGTFRLESLKEFVARTGLGPAQAAGMTSAEIKRFMEAVKANEDLASPPTVVTPGATPGRELVFWVD